MIKDMDDPSGAIRREPSFSTSNPALAPRQATIEWTYTVGWSSWMRRNSNRWGPWQHACPLTSTPAFAHHSGSRIPEDAKLAWLEIWVPKRCQHDACEDGVVQLAPSKRAKTDSTFCSQPQRGGGPQMLRHHPREMQMLEEEVLEVMTMSERNWATQKRTPHCLRQRPCCLANSTFIHTSPLVFRWVSQGAPWVVRDIKSMETKKEIWCIFLVHFNKIG